MTTVLISQPMYFPWIGFMGQMSLADVLIWLDDAQFSKGSFTNRVQVKGATGPIWMTIPLKAKGSFQQIGDLEASDASWRGRHRALIQQQLKGAPYLHDALNIYDNSVAAPDLLSAIISSAELPAEFLGLLPPTRVRSSHLEVEGRSSERVLALVKAVGGTRYVTGHGAAGYLDHAAFEEEGIEVLYPDYDVRPWPQSHGPFTPFVTALDGIAHAGTALVESVPRSTIYWREFLSLREGAALSQV